MRFFIKRPSVIDMIRERVSVPEQDDDDAHLEAMLRTELNRVSPLRLGRAFAFRVFLMNTVLYVLGEKARAHKNYDCVITHVETEEEYQANNKREPEVKRTRTAQRQRTVLLRYPNGDGHVHITEHPLHEIRQVILELLRKGVADQAIEVLKPVPWNIEITLEDAA